VVSRRCTDNRALVRALWTAAQSFGVDVRDRITVEAIQQQQRMVAGVQTSVSNPRRTLCFGSGCVDELLLLPVRPKKGNYRCECLRANGVLPPAGFICTDIYIVPRRDGRIVIGATSEEGIYTPQHPSWHSSLTRTSDQALSTIQHYPIQEFWWGSAQRRQMSYPFLALALANLTLATGPSQWHSACGNSYPDCRLDLGAKSDSLLISNTHGLQ